MPVYYNEFKDGPAKYYQSKNTGQVIGVIDGYNKPMYFHFKSTNVHNELFYVNCNLEEDGYSEIVPPKTGDIILLKFNRINMFSPHCGHQFKVQETRNFRIVLNNLVTNENLVIDIRNWVWEKITSEGKNDLDINDGDIIEKDGKQFIVTLTEVIPQKYPIGTVINDVFVIIDTCLTKDNKHRYYTLWNRKFGKIWYRREDEIPELYNLK